MILMPAPLMIVIPTMDVLIRPLTVMITMNVLWMTVTQTLAVYIRPMIVNILTPAILFPAIHFMDANLILLIVMITTHVLLILVILTVLNIRLVFMKTSFVMITTNVRKIIAAHVLDVFSMIFPAIAVLLINAMTPIVIK
jgi:hypothetical protein